MSMKLTLATLILAVLPAVASAMCTGTDHKTSASACAQGQVWDGATQACVDTNA